MGIIVIGSGPAAIAATVPLVRQGHHVTILDVGTRLEPEIQQIVNRMSAGEPASWRKDDLESITGKRTAAREINHSKTSYGSSYSIDTRLEAVDVRWKNIAGFNHSLARGGLSNIWGSSLLPYRREDFKDWPISLQDLEPHYRAVMDFVPGTAINDELAELFPSYSNQANSLEPSRQGQSLLDDLRRNKARIRTSKIFFGRSRLAIRSIANQTSPGCVYCARCLNGCPYGLIYSSAQTLEKLIANGSVSYYQDHLVEKIETAGEKVIVTGRNLAKNTEFTYIAGRVFTGAGVLPTAKIILNSLQAFNRPVRLLDSQYFVYPLLRFRSIDGVETEPMHTSAQVFLEIDDQRVSKHLVHLQVYGFSSFLLDELKRTFLGQALRIPAFRRAFLGRLLIVQGFLHSEESGSIKLVLRKATDGRVFLEAETQRSLKTIATILRTGWKLVKQTINFRALPLIPNLLIFRPGSGYHCGGTFPMRDHPQEFETDSLGRLPSMDRVHLVDASILPSIPATSITFSVMANAHRIATFAARLDPP